MDKSLLSIITIMAALIGIVLFLIWFPEQETSDIDLLSSKPISSSIALTDRTEPCFTIDDGFLNKYPELKEKILEINKEASSSVIDEYEHTRRYVDFERDSALSIIGAIPYSHSIKKHPTAPESIEDTAHVFQCVLQHNDRFYDLRIEFGFSLPADTGFTLIKIKREEGLFGKFMLEPADATTWLSFNNTVIWKNELSEPIAIVSDGNSPNERFDEFATSSNMIKLGEITSFTLTPDWSRYENQTFHYTVEPYGLKGSISVNWYPRCMTQEIVKSLYSQTKLYVKFPQYLPEGYRYQCGIHVFGTAVALTYWNGTNPDFDLYSHGFERGVIRVSIIKELQDRDKENAAEQMYNEIKDLKPLEPAFLRINGDPAVASRIFLGDEEVAALYRVHLFFDQETYVFEGKVPIEELVKMVESLNAGNHKELDKIFMTTSHFAYPPAMAVDSEGSIHVVWSSDISKGSSALHYAKIEHNENVVIKVLSDYAYNPNIAIFNDSIHIVWTDYRSLDANYELYYMQLDYDGNVVINEKRLTNAQDKSDYPSITVDNEGNVHMVWEDWRDSYTRVIGTRPDCIEESSYNLKLWSFKLYKGEGCEIYESKTLAEIYYMKLDASGNKIIEDRRITFKDNFTNGASFRPRVAFDGTDQLHIVWWDRRDVDRIDSHEAEIYYTKLDLVGSKLLSDVRVTNAPRDSAWPELAVDSKGNAHVVWFDDRLDTNSSGKYEIYKTTISKGGIKIMNDIRISSFIRNTFAGWPNVTIDENDKIHVVWNEVWTLYEVEPPTGYKSGIYYTRINADGIVEQSPVFVAEGGSYSDVVTSGSKVYVVSDDGTELMITEVLRISS